MPALPERETPTLPRALLAPRNGRRAAIAVGGDEISYRSLEEMVLLVARALIESGLQAGERVLLRFDNNVEYIVALLAVTEAGGIAIPVDVRAGAKRLAFVASATGARIWLAPSEAKSPDAGTATQIEMRFDLAPATIRITPNPRTAVASAKLDRGNLDAPALILFSSGSTGRPKGVMLAHRQLTWVAGALAARYQLNEDHRELILCPLTHSDGWQRVAATLYAGGCVVLPPEPLAVTGMLEDLTRHRITGFFAPPPLLRMLLKTSPAKAKAALRTCRSIEIGSAPVTGEELAQLARLAPKARIFVHYGLTECSRALVLDAIEDQDKRHTVGAPLPGVEIEIRDEAGQVLGAGQPGQIFLRGPQLFLGYWNDEDLTRAQLIDGWLATGDYGSLDEDGFLKYRGRRDDMINCSGHHYFPAEIETELGVIEGVSEYLIAGIRDPRGVLETIPWAFVVPCEPKAWRPGEFLKLARTRLPSYMVPRGATGVPSLPLTPSGKYDRRRALELYAAATPSVQ